MSLRQDILRLRCVSQMWRYAQFFMEKEQYGIHELVKVPKFRDAVSRRGL